MSRYNTKFANDIKLFKRRCSDWLIGGMRKNDRAGDAKYISENTGINLKTIYEYVSAEVVPNSYKLYLIDGYLNRGIRHGGFMNEEWFRRECTSAIKEGMTRKGVCVMDVARATGIDHKSIRKWLSCKVTPNSFYLYLVDEYLDGVVRERFEEV